MKPHYTELKDKHKDQMSYVMGGGLLLQEHLDKHFYLYPDRDVPLIAVNEWAGRLIQPLDYIVYQDRACIELIKDQVGTHITRLESSAYDMEGHTWGDGYWVGSGQVAVFWACYMGCDPIWLLGMDCYVGYKDTKVRRFPSNWFNLDWQLEKWEAFFLWLRRNGYDNEIYSAGHPLDGLIKRLDINK